MIEDNPRITQAEMAAELGLTRDGVRYHIKKMESEGVIEHIGGSYGGEWKIIG